MADQLRVDAPSPPRPRPAPRPRRFPGSRPRTGRARRGRSRRSPREEPLGALEHPADRLQVQPLGLHFAGQLDPGDVLLAVVAGAALHLRRRQQAARLVGADVADRHPGAPRQLADRHLAVGGLRAVWPACSSGHRKREPLTVHLRGRVGAEEGDRLGDVLGGGEGGEVLAGALLPHPRGQDRVDDDDVGGGAAGLEAVGEGERPGLGGRLGGGVGGVGVGRRLRLLGGDEDEAAVLARRELRRGRRGWCAGRCGSAGRGAGPSPASGASCSGCPPRQPPTRWTRPSTRPKRSTSAAHHSRDRRPRRAGRRRGRPSARPESRARRRARRARSWSRSVPATWPRPRPAAPRPAARGRRRPRRSRSHGRRARSYGGGRIRTCVGRANGFTARLL